MAERRILVIGLDGATWDLARPWAEEGKLPHLSRMLAGGTAGHLMSTIPPISPAAWSSFMTGKNPGKHGVFDFTVRDFDTYGMRVATRPREPTLWGLLSAQQRRVCIVNVPQTYPPEQVNGIMVAGLGTPSQRVFTHPAELTQTLRREDYRIVTDTTVRRDGPQRFLAEVFQTAEQITDTALRLLGEEDWDLGMVVLRLTDEIPHFFWHWMDESHPSYQPGDAFLREAIQRCYEKADELVGKLVAGVDERETTVFIVSDHGFGPLHKDVYLNEWLRQQGYLVYRSHLTARALFKRLMQRLGLTRTQVGQTLSRWGLHWLRGTLRDGLGALGEAFPNDSQPRVAELVDWERTQAYSVGYIGQIYLNVAGRDPLGIVSPGQEYEQLRTELGKLLLEMTDPEDGKPIVDRVLHREEVYEGQHLSHAPDLLVLMRGLTYITRQSYETAERGRICGLPPTGETGGHRQEGILLAWGDQITKDKWVENTRIEDIAPTILHLLGCQVPPDMDGRVLTGLLDPEWLATHPVSYGDSQLQPEATDALTPEEEENLMEHLRNLGYVG